MMIYPARRSFAPLSALLALGVGLSTVAGCARRPVVLRASTPVAPIAGGGVAGRPAPRDYVSMPNLRDIQFDFDAYTIRPKDARTLDANADLILSHRDWALLIEGHCDERGTNQYNIVLGDHRARAVMNYLIARGVRADRMATISYGEERPRCTERTEACWARNRRAHLAVKRTAPRR